MAPDKARFFEALSDFDASVSDLVPDNQRSAFEWLRVEKGDIGIIWHLKRKGKEITFGYATHYGRPGSGWLPIVVARPGPFLSEPVTWKDANQEVVIITTSQLTQTLLPRALFKTLIGFINSVASRASATSEMPSSMINVIRSASTSERLVSSILSGMRRDFLESLASNKASVELFKTGESAYTSKDQGIYWIFYQKPNGTIGLYIGMTTNFQNRYYGHWASIKNPQTSHHRFARACFSDQQMETPISQMPLKMFILTRIPKSKSIELRVAEMIMIMLFNSWSYRHFETIGSDEAARPVEQQGWLELTRKTMMDFVKIAEQVSKYTGWTGMWVNSAPQYRGLNYSNPAYERGHGKERTPWYKVSIPDRMEIYRRSPLKAFVEYKKGPQGDEVSVCKIPLGLPEMYSINVQDLTSSPKQLFTPVIEVMMHGVAHHTPFFRLETVGPYSDWDRYKSVGIALEYETPEGRMKRHIQRQSKVLDTLYHGNARHAYYNGFALLAFLERTSFTGDKPSFLKDFQGSAIANVFTIRYDPMKGNILKEAAVQQPERPWPHVKPSDQIRSELSPPLRIANTLRPNGGSTKCDFCLYSTDRKCNGLNSLTGTCQSCYILRRPCTYTDMNVQDSERLKAHATWIRSTPGPALPFPGGPNIDEMFIDENEDVERTGATKDDTGTEGLEQAAREEAEAGVDVEAM